ncbi:substrate-binding periplasmic protein [Undibacterium sp. SXout11W]|uniref:substrate-binding periplasmic protein n=1 Tax=Undibacterium sp. SXout11W TaxID=3413050 RepID=UPI003BF2CD11
MLSSRLNFFFLLVGLSIACAQDVVARCSRPVSVAFSLSGFQVALKDQVLLGVYPDVLKRISSKDGCEFTFSVVPRARQELMFKNGQTDLMIPAIRTTRRDESGIFVRLVYSRATLISIHSDWPAISSSQELLNAKSMRVVVVRGYDYGDEYVRILQELKKQSRLVYEADPVSAARTLKSGAAQYALMLPCILFGEIKNDPRVSDLVSKLHYDTISEIPWMESGVYLSRKSLSNADRNYLKALFENTANSALVWKLFQNYYGPEVLNLGLRPH